MGQNQTLSFVAALGAKSNDLTATTALSGLNMVFLTITLLLNKDCFSLFQNLMPLIYAGKQEYPC